MSESLESLLLQEDIIQGYMYDIDPSSDTYQKLNRRLEIVCAAIEEHPDHQAKNFDELVDGLAVVSEAIDTVIEMLAQLQDVLRGMAEKRQGGQEY